MARKVDRVQHRRNVLVRIRVRLSSEAADNLTATWTECNHVLALPVAEHLLWDIFQAFSVHFGRRQELNKWNWDGGNWTTNSPPSYSITVEMYFSVPCCLCAYKWLFWTQRPLNFWLETGSRMLQVNMFTTSIHTHTHTHTHTQHHHEEFPFLKILTADNEKRTGRRRKLTLKTLCSWRPLCCMDSVTND